MLYGHVEINRASIVAVLCVGLLAATKLMCYITYLHGGTMQL